jgi:flagellar export protein FliJ
MKTFKFSLESVQRLRQHQEQAALDAYARALLDKARAVEQLHSAEHALAEEQIAWQRHTSEGCSAGALARHALQSSYLTRRVRERNHALGEAERRVQARLSEVLQARLRRETLNKLRARRRHVFDRTAAREQQKFLDDLAQRRSHASLDLCPAEASLNNL